MTTTYRIDTSEELLRHAEFIADSGFSEVEIVVSYDATVRSNVVDGGTETATAVTDSADAEHDADDGPIAYEVLEEIADDLAESEAGDTEADDDADEGKWPEIKHKDAVPEGVCPICGKEFSNPRSVGPHTRGHTTEERAEAGYAGAQREMSVRDEDDERTLETPDAGDSLHLALTYLARAKRAGLTPIPADDLQDLVDDSDGDYVRCSSALSRLYKMRMVDREKRPLGYNGRMVNAHWPTAFGMAFIEDEGEAAGAASFGETDE